MFDKSKQLEQAVGQPNNSVYIDLFGYFYAFESRKPLKQVIRLITGWLIRQWPREMKGS